MSDSEQQNKKVLFADTEQSSLNAVLEELSHADFDLYLAGTEEEAQDVLNRHRLDLVLCGMGIAETGSFDFLKKLREEHPNVHSAVLCSNDRRDEASFAVARGYATAIHIAPWEEGVLYRSIEHTLRVRHALMQGKMLEVLNELENLPSLPSLYQEFTEAVYKERPANEIAEIIERDVSLSTKLLQIANSAFYGMASICSVELAIVRLGLSTVKDMVMTFSLVNDMEWDADQMKHVQSVFRHSLLVNRYMKKVHNKKYGSLLRQDMACLGIMHDIGKIIILQYFPDRYAMIMDHSLRNPGQTFYECENDLGFDWFRHDDVGAYFLSMWNLPDHVVEATLYHHRPSESQDQIRQAVDVLAFTDRLVERVESMDDEEEAGAMNLADHGEGFIGEKELRSITREIREAMKEEFSVAGTD